MYGSRPFPNYPPIKTVSTSHRTPNADKPKELYYYTSRPIPCHFWAQDLEAVKSGALVKTLKQYGSEYKAYEQISSAVP